MKLSALATLALLLALPACGEDKEDTATEATNVTTTATDGMTGTDGTTAGTDGTTADATTADATTADATTMEGTTADAPTTDAPTTGEPTTGEPTTGSAGLSFATDIWAPILAKSCDCHGGGPTGGLLLGMDAATAYASMVGVASSIGMNYVTPGDPDDSYVFHKVAGTQVEAGGNGGQMPPGAPALDQAQLDAIAAWIADGAAQ